MLKAIAVIIITIIILSIYLTEKFTTLTMTKRLVNNTPYISLVDSENKIIWETIGDNWEIRHGELVFLLDNSVILRSNTKTGKSIKLQNGGEFHGLNLIDSQGRILWNPSHYSKFIDKKEYFKRGYIMYKNPVTGKLFTIS